VGSAEAVIAIPQNDLGLWDYGFFTAETFIGKFLNYERYREEFRSEEVSAAFAMTPVVDFVSQQLWIFPSIVFAMLIMYVIWKKFDYISDALVHDSALKFGKKLLKRQKI
jgi:hypothetical protein